MIEAIQAVNVAGSLTGVNPAVEDGYVAGQKAYLYIEADLSVQRSWYDEGFILVYFNIFRSNHTLIARVSKTRTLWLWETEVEWPISFMQEIGYMPITPLLGYVEMVWGDTLLGQRNFSVPLISDDNGDNGGKQFPWKEIAIGAGLVTIVVIAVRAAGR